MSHLSAEVLVIILHFCLDDSADLQSQRKDWLSLRHTSAQFQALLLSVDLQDFNPFKNLLATLDGEEENRFDAAFKGWTRELKHMNTLQSTTSFPITVGLEFLRCLVQLMNTIHAVFDSLEENPVLRNIQLLQITLATDQTHWIPIPAFPTLENLHLNLDDATTVGEICCLGHGIGNYEAEPTIFVVRAPKLWRLKIVTRNPSIVRVTNPEYLEDLSVDLQQVGCGSCGKDRNRARHTLEDMVTRQGTMFDDFGGIAAGLTHLDLSVKFSWLEGTSTLRFPSLTVFNLRTTNPMRQPTSAPVTVLQLPKVERMCLFLCDTRTIDFAESSMPSLRHLRVFTPCYVKNLMGGEEGTRTRRNFLVNYQNLEHITIAAHGIEKSSPLIRVEWESVKRVTLAMDVGIADLVGDVKMPILEEITLIYPQWRVDQYKGRGETWDKVRETMKELVDTCYDEEIEKLSKNFPGIPTKGCLSFDGPDNDCFDVMKKAYRI